MNLQESKQLIHSFLSFIVEEVFPLDDSFEKRIFEEISRKVEVRSGHRDIWGNWDWSYSNAHLEGNLYVPWIDKMVIGQSNKEVKNRWPGNKKFALCLSHDVDWVDHSCLKYKWRNVLRTLKYMKGKAVDRSILVTLAKNIIKLASYSLQAPSKLIRQRRLNDDYYKTWLELEASFGFCSTFFFFPSYLEKPHPFDCCYQFHDTIVFNGKKMSVGKMMQLIDAYGWEIGLHGSYSSAIVPGLLEHEKKQVEEIIEKPVISIRQHWLHYEASITPILQAQAGFKVDSTQGFNRSVGFRAGTSFPYYCWDHQKERVLPLLEIPQHIMDVSLFMPNSLEYNEEMAIKHCLLLMDEVESVGGCLTLSWHPNATVDSKSYGVYKELLQEASRRNAWGCSVKNLYEWWSANNKMGHE